MGPQSGVVSPNRRYSVNGIPADIPSSGIFRVVDSRRCSEPMKSRVRSRSTRNITVLHIGSCSRTVLPFGQNQEPSRRRASTPRQVLQSRTGTKTKRATVFPGCARLNVDDMLVALPAVALIFRGPLQQIQAQSHFATDTRNIPELGISAEISVRQFPATFLDLASVHKCLRIRDLCK